MMDHTEYIQQERSRWYLLFIFIQYERFVSVKTRAESLVPGTGQGSRDLDIRRQRGAADCARQGKVCKVGSPNNPST